jgi:metal-responsive CopG/Arc/MetJ family transcriptional regulator
MKIAISVPDDIFKEAERLARKTKRSRSELYSLALKEFLARHSPEQITEAMNNALAEIDEGAEEFTREAARKTLGRDEW